MNDSAQYFGFEMAKVNLEYFYAYFLLAAVIAFFLVYKSKSKYKIELFFMSFYLLTGNINEILTIKIPGFGLFEIQPERFIFLSLLFLVFRKTFLSRNQSHLHFNKKIPWFGVALLGYIIMLVLSVIINISDVGISVSLRRIVGAVTFLVFIISLRVMADKPSYDLIGKSFIVGAVLSSIVSLIQLLRDPYFLRIGGDRIAFGDILRSNGIFSTEYFNSYFLIIAITWTLTTVKNNYLKISLVTLFSLGVLSSFQRMSWLILALVIITYLVYVQKLGLEKLALISLSGLALILSISIFYYQDIMNSSLVKERLTDSVDRRQGYYSMVLDNIGKKPLFGYGGLENEVYYVNIMRITGDRDRASAQSGDLHSGYFSALFLYGIPAFICFVLFVLLSVFYYARLYKENVYFVIPFLVSVLYMIGNLTNTFLFLKYISVLFAIHIGIGMGINQIREGSVPEN
jgi:hypothetical protein